MQIKELRYQLRDLYLYLNLELNILTSRAISRLYRAIYDCMSKDAVELNTFCNLINYNTAFRDLACKPRCFQAKRFSFFLFFFFLLLLL